MKPALRLCSSEHCPKPGGICSENRLLEKSRRCIEGEELQTKDGSGPEKLLLLTSKACSFDALSRNEDLIVPLNELQDKLKVVVVLGRLSEAERASPERRLRLKSIICRVVSEAKNLSGRGPERALRERLRRERAVRFMTEGEMVPTRPRDGSHRVVTLLEPSQPTPSQPQQSTERDQLRGGVAEMLRLNEDKESRSS